MRPLSLRVLLVFEVEFEAVFAHEQAAVFGEGYGGVPAVTGDGSRGSIKGKCLLL